MSTFYNEDFYKGQQDESTLAAIKVIPRLLEIIQPKSVLDIGCGIGTWLNVFKNKYGIKEVTGVDGDYVDKNMLLIDKTEFVPYNLEKVYTPAKKYDLAISMEVGEHLPDSCADNLVASLTGASDFIMFSAALPGQTGTNHINEQFPEYWAKKFIARGYVCVDCIRKQIWNDRDIEPWYRQNVLIYIKKELYENQYQQKLGSYKEKTDPEFLTRVHPDLMDYFREKFYQTRSLVGFLRFHLKPVKVFFTGQKKNRKQALHMLP